MKQIVRDSARLISANIAAQAISLLVYPVLTRMYSPDDFGLLNLFVSIGGVLVLIATADYQNAIVLPKEEKKSSAVGMIGLLLLGLVTALIALTVPFSTTIAGWFNTPELAKWYWLLPVFVLLSGLWSLLNYYRIRHQQFANISVYSLTSISGNVISKIIFGSLRMAGGLIWGTVLGPLVGLLSCAFSPRVRRPKEKIEWPQLRQVAREYKNFPLFSLPCSLVNSLSNSLPAFVLTPVFGLTELGFFGMAITLALRPIKMVSQSIYQVLFQQVADAINQKRSFRPIIRSFIRKAILVILPSFAILWFVLPWLVRILLGEGWDETAELIRMFLPWLALVAIGGTISFLSDVFGRQKKAAVIEVIYMLLRLAGLAIGVALGSFQWAVGLYALAGCFTITYQLIWYHQLIDAYENQIA